MGGGASSRLSTHPPIDNSKTGRGANAASLFPPACRSDHYLMGLLRIIRVPYQPVRSLTVVCTIYKCHVNWCGCTQYRVCWCGGPVTQDDITAAEAERAKLKAKEVQPINRHSWFAQTSFAAVTATDPRSICTTLAARRSDSVSRRQLPVFGKNNESL